MAHYRLHNIRDAEDGDGWTINSRSGATYLVTREMRHNRYEYGYSFRFHCTCPARKRCRHTNAVEAMLHAEIHSAIEAGDDGGIDDMEILERTT